MEWKVVSSKNKNMRFSVWKDRSGKHLGENETISSFFFTEIPEGYNAREMAKIFMDFGLVHEVFIPAKLDKRGKRYGFVRFRKVENERTMAISLDNIQIKGMKLYMNIPRFDRKRVIESREPRYIHKGEEHNKEGQNKFYGSNVRKGRSYVDVTRGDYDRRNSNRKHEGVDKEFETGKSYPNWGGLLFKTKDEEIKCFEKAYVGVMKKSGNSYNIQDIFHKEGFFNIRVTPMGANLCLLEDLEENAISSLVKKEETWLQNWLEDIRGWSPAEVDKEILTWVKCFGIPCHVWRNDFFKYIASRIGEFICCDEETESHSKFDVARTLIKIKYTSNLNEVISVEVNDLVFVIKLVEDNHGPKRIVFKDHKRHGLVDSDESSVEETEDETDEEDDTLDRHSKDEDSDEIEASSNGVEGMGDRASRISTDRFRSTNQEAGKKCKSNHSFSAKENTTSNKTKKLVFEGNKTARLSPEKMFEESAFNVVEAQETSMGQMEKNRAKRREIIRIDDTAKGTMCVDRLCAEKNSFMNVKVVGPYKDTSVVSVVGPNITCLLDHRTPGKISKKPLRKKKSVQEIYENVKIPYEPSYYSKLLHTSFDTKLHKTSEGAFDDSMLVSTQSGEKEFRYSGGSILSCDSVSDGDVVAGNERIKRNSEDVPVEP